jgi:hypothetical protein
MMMTMTKKSSSVRLAQVRLVGKRRVVVHLVISGDDGIPGSSGRLKEPGESASTLIGRRHAGRCVTVACRSVTAASVGSTISSPLLPVASAQPQLQHPKLLHLHQHAAPHHSMGMGATHSIPGRLSVPGYLDNPLRSAGMPQPHF